MSGRARWRGWLRGRRETPSLALPGIWTNSHHRAITFLLAIYLIVLTVLAIRRPTYIASPPGPGDRAGELADQIDPNTADAATLSALPLLGPSKAGAIIRYREAARARRPDRPAFTSADDLLAVDGIGATTVKQLSPYLRFPSNAPASRGTTER